MAACERSIMSVTERDGGRSSCLTYSGHEVVFPIYWFLLHSERVAYTFRLITACPSHQSMIDEVSETGGDIWVWRLSIRKADAIRSSSTEHSTRSGSWSQPWFVHMRAVGTVISMLSILQWSAFGFSLRQRIPNVLSISELQQARLDRCPSICGVCSLLSSWDCPIAVVYFSLLSNSIRSKVVSARNYFELCKGH